MTAASAIKPHPAEVTPAHLSPAQSNLLVALVSGPAFRRVGGWRQPGSARGHKLDSADRLLSLGLAFEQPGRGGTRLVATGHGERLGREIRRLAQAGRTAK